MAAFMMVAALWRFPTALSYLLWRAEEPHPTDLHARHSEVTRWFDGIAESPRAGRADYPPASYPLLWPLLGWLSLTHARWLWGLTTVAALGLLAFQMVAASSAPSRAQRALLMLLPFSAYATSATLSTGQLGNHVLPMIVGGLTLFRYGRGRWWADATGAVMLLFALVKPILSAPFFWIACFATGRVRPVLLVTTGYIALTALAVSFQTEDIVTVVTGWLAETPNLPRGTANLHKALWLLGVPGWVLPATLITLVGTGWWVYRHRRSDLWVLLGVAALVSRLAFHHRLYDDLLLFIPMVTLLRIAVMRAGAGHRDLMAGALFTLMWLTLHVPAQLFGWPQPVPALVEGWQVSTWLLVLMFLLDEARRQARSGVASPAYDDTPVSSQ